MPIRAVDFKKKLIDSFAPVLSGQDNGRQFKRRSWLHKLTVELTGELVVGVAAATLLQDGILRLFKKIVFNLMADVSPFSINGRLLHRINSYIASDRERITQPAVTVGTNAFRVSFDLNFVMPDFYLPESFKLNTKIFRGKEIQNPVTNFNLGTVADVATPGGGGTVALQNLLLNIYAKDENGPSVPLNIEGFVREEIQFLDAVTANSENAGTFDLRDNNIIRRVAILARDNATGLLSDAAVDTVKIVRNEDDVLREWKWADLQAQNKKEYQLGDDLFNAIKTGFAIVNLDEEFDLSGVIDTRLEKGTNTMSIKLAPVAGVTMLLDASREVIVPKR